MSNLTTETTSSEEDKNTATETLTTDTDTDTGNNQPVITVEPTSQEQKNIGSDDNLQDDGAPDDYQDREALKGKPDEAKSEQDNYDECIGDDKPEEKNSFEKLEGKALLAYETGRMAIYMAIAWIYIWMYLVNKDKNYKEEVFKGEVNQTNSEDYTKAIKVCLKLADSQKSTVSLYKDVMLFLDKALPDTIKCDLSDSEHCAKRIATYIKDNGGVIECAKKGKSDAPSGRKNGTSPNDYKRKEKEYAYTTEVAGSFVADEIKEFEDLDLIVMVGRVAEGTDDTVEIVDMLTDDDLLKHFIKCEKAQAEAIKEAKAIKLTEAEASKKV